MDRPPNPADRSKLTSAEAADALGITRTSLHRWVASGKLVPVYRGPGRNGIMLFDPADVEALRPKAAVPA